MNRICLFVLLLLAARVNAQVQPTYEKKIFRDESGNLFWNLSLPVYLEISTTPDVKNVTPLLNVKAEDMKKFANPMHFDGHGIHYIKHTDKDNPIAEKEVAFPVNVDGYAPKTSLTLQGASLFAGAKLYYGKNLQATIAAKDEMSGVETIQQSVNAAAYAAYTSALAFQQEGPYSLKYFAVDRVGNVENAQAKDFIVDLTAPESKHSVSIDHINGIILSPRSRIQLASTDQLSGVKSIGYKIDDAQQIQYAQEFGLKGLTDGEHTNSYSAIDNVKNEEQPKQHKFYYDAIAPVVTSSFSGDFYIKNKITYMAKNASFSLSATDNKAGVKDIHYSLNDGSAVLYSTPVGLPKQGPYQAKFKSSDNVNNQTGWNTNDELRNLFLDETPPTITHSYKGPLFLTRDTVFINNTTLVQLFAADQESGVLSIDYQSDASASKNYTAPFNEAAEGYHTVQFTGTDQVKNKRSDQFFFVVDNNGPEIFYHVSLDKIKMKKSDKGSSLVPVYSMNTSFYLAATDNLVGTKAIYFQLDKNPEVIYSTPVKMIQKGFHSMTIRAIDNLGNQAPVKVVDFIVE